MNTPYFVGSNDENAMETSPLAPPNTIKATPHNRRVLGEVSTNPRVYGSSPATGGLFGGQKRALMGSPLKRSFTAAVEEGYGLKYLKRRRGEGDVLGFQGVGTGRIEEGVAGAGAGPVDPAIGGVRAQSVPEGVVTHHAPPDPTIGFPPSPTEPNTPSDSGGETQGSFSSLIDYDPSSQHATTTTTRPRSRQKKKQQQQHKQPQQQQQWNPREEQQHQQQSIQQQPLAPPQSPPKTITHAETLRLRLHLAMYKIQTNQIHLPFSELKLPNPQISSSSHRQHINDAVEEAVASLRREAMERMPKQGQTPTTLIPGPLLHPTAHSSRMVPHPEQQRAASRLPPVGVFGRHGSAPLPSGMRGEIEGWER